MSKFRKSRLASAMLCTLLFGGNAAGAMRENISKENAILKLKDRSEKCMSRIFGDIFLGSMIIFEGFNEKASYDDVVREMESDEKKNEKNIKLEGNDANEKSSILGKYSLYKYFFVKNFRNEISSYLSSLVGVFTDVLTYIGLRNVLNKICKSEDMQGELINSNDLEQLDILSFDKIANTVFGADKMFTSKTAVIRVGHFYVYDHANFEYILDGSGHDNDVKVFVRNGDLHFNDGFKADIAVLIGDSIHDDTIDLRFVLKNKACLRLCISYSYLSRKFGFKNGEKSELFNKIVSKFGKNPKQTLINII